jgi:hypothetical protein
MHYCAAVCTSHLPLFLSHKRCRTWPASTDVSQLVDSPLHPKTESQHTDLTWTDVECDTPYFISVASMNITVFQKLRKF